MAEFALALSGYLRSAEDAPRPPDELGPLPGQLEGADLPAHEAREPERPAQPSQKPEEVEPPSSELPIAVPEPETLWEAWNQWTRFVEHFAMRRSRHRVNRNAYASLYKYLIDECRTRAAQARGPKREFYLKLEELVLPWMTARVLEFTDPEILFSVLSHCRTFEQELMDQTPLAAKAEGQSGVRVAIYFLTAAFAFEMVCLWFIRFDWKVAIGLLVGVALLGLIGVFVASRKAKPGPPSRPGPGTAAGPEDRRRGRVPAETSAASRPLVHQTPGAPKPFPDGAGRGELSDDLVEAWPVSGADARTDQSLLHAPSPSRWGSGASTLWKSLSQIRDREK
jgi:hypothetical protein